MPKKKKAKGKMTKGAKSRARAFRDRYRRLYGKDWRFHMLADNHNKRTETDMDVEHLKDLYETQTQCYYCNDTLEFSKKRMVAIEHLTPIKRGGTNLSDNLVLSCSDCNLAKGTMLEIEYLEYLKEFPKKVKKPKKKILKTKPRILKTKTKLKKETKPKKEKKE